jgi:hypothetical protein
MVNLSALAPITTAATALSNLVLVSPQKTIGYQPQNAADQTGQQPPPLLFHYEGEQSVMIQSDITDHFVEDNTSIQDQIALKPVEINTDGFIGELNDIPPKSLQLLQTLANKLTVVDAYTPVLSATALIAYTEALLLYQTTANAVNSAVSAWSSLSGQDGENVIGSNGLGQAFDATTGKVANNQTKQQVAYQQFYGYWNNRTLFTVQTPWAVFQNMAIKSVQAIQDAETRVISNFKVSFKMIRFANTQSTNGITAILQGRAAAQASGLVDLGTTTPSPSISVADALSRIA